MTCKIFYHFGACPGNSRGGRFLLPRPHHERGDMLQLFGELVRIAAGELWAALVDAKQTGDYAGHLAAWWGLMTGRVDPEARYRAVDNEP